MRITVVRTYGWVNSLKGNVPVTRVDVDDWESTAMESLSREVDRLVEDSDREKRGKTETRGVLMLQLGRGPSEDVIDLLKTIYPSLSDHDLAALQERCYGGSKNEREN